MKEDKIESGRLKKFILDGYVCGEKKIIKVNETAYEIQMYQGDHKNDYLISEMRDGKVEGRCNLFHSGLLSLSYIMKDGERIGGITEYVKGKAVCKEGWSGLLGKDDRRIIGNSKEGLSLLIHDKDTDHVVYRGQFDVELRRDGEGIEYDRESGEMRYEGCWKKDDIIRIVREFNGDEMIEYEDCDNADVLKRIPLYIGGYNVVNGDIKRNGTGYLIDGKTGTAIRESEWLNGEEVKSIDLHSGWYFDGINESIRDVLNNEQPIVSEEQVFCDNLVIVKNSNDLSAVSRSVNKLVITSSCCNDVISLNLNGFDRLRNAEIGDECFENVDTFRIDGLNRLKSLKIGMNSFTKKKNEGGNNPSRSFHVTNCAKLESIEIGKFSFSDYSGEFELKNLPYLSSIKVGETGSGSWSFYYSSFVVKDLPNLQSIQLGSYVFYASLSTVISNLPNLKFIQLGWGALGGRFLDDSCSVEMKDLPQLEEVTSDEKSFQYPRSVTLSNIPYLKRVNLPNSFLEVKTKSISNVSTVLADLVSIVLPALDPKPKRAPKRTSKRTQRRSQRRAQKRTPKRPIEPEEAPTQIQEVVPAQQFVFTPAWYMQLDKYR